MFSFDTTQHGCYSELLKNKEEAHGQIAHPRNQTHLLKAMIISQHWFGEGKTIISFLISEWSLFVKPWVSFTKGCFVTSLVEIGPVVLEKKMFKFRQCIFAICVIISPLKRAGPFIWTNLNPLHPRMLCAKFGWNWPSGSGEEDENVKSLPTDGQTDRQTTGDQKSSLELSAQVS